MDAATVKRLLASYAGESPASAPGADLGAPAAAVSTPPAPVNLHPDDPLHDIKLDRINRSMPTPSRT